MLQVEKILKKRLRDGNKLTNCIRSGARNLKLEATKAFSNLQRNFLIRK